MTKFELQYQTKFRVQHDVQIQRLIIPLSSLHKPSVECYTHLKPKLKKNQNYQLDSSSYPENQQGPVSWRSPAGLV